MAGRILTADTNKLHTHQGAPMTRFLALILIGMATLVARGGAVADEAAPWGRARAIDQDYSKQKVVYDLTSAVRENVVSVLDRISYLSILNNADPFDSKIVVVIHGGAIPFFAIRNYGKYKNLMERAYSLSLNGSIEFRMCKIAAHQHGFEPRDIHGFVAMVPMADAEIVRLQQEGFAYMR
jgi:intracellular sulfur oxidation DsrE/DsrF family protein